MSETTPIVTDDELNMQEVPTPVPVPAPATKPEESEIITENVDADRLLADILSLDEDKHANTQILFVVERLHDVQDGMTLDDIPDENKELLYDMNVENAAIDVYSLDGEISCLNFVFDTEKDVYIHEIDDFMNRYRLAQEELQTEESGKNDLIMLSVLLMPNTVEYQAFLQFAFPIWWGRVVGVTGKGNVMTLMFHNDNIDAHQIDMTEEDMTEITADVLREMESGTGGNLFE